MYVLDSCICIELMRGRLPHTFELMKRTSPDLFRIASVVEAELATGVEKCPEHLRSRTRYVTEAFLAPYESLPFDSACVSAYARIRAHLESRGMKIGPNDLLIAATAFANDATLITRNVREFSRIPGLRVEDWEEVDF